MGEQVQEKRGTIVDSEEGKRIIEKNRKKTNKINRNLEEMSRMDERILLEHSMSY